MDKITLTELANKLYMYTDEQRWQDLLDEVFTTDIWLDVSSMGGGDARIVKAADLCNMWEEGFKGIDQVHHQAGHYIINVNENDASIFGYAVAYHYKASAVNGKTRTFVGSYDLKAVNTDKGWRLNQFKYNLKFIDGNVTLE